jgi:hypothetical protein
VLAAQLEQNKRIVQCLHIERSLTLNWRQESFSHPIGERVNIKVASLLTIYIHKNGEILRELPKLGEQCFKERVIAAPPD